MLLRNGSGVPGFQLAALVFQRHGPDLGRGVFRKYASRLPSGVNDHGIWAFLLPVSGCGGLAPSARAWKMP